MSILRSPASHCINMGHEDLRPKKRANDVSVPNSASNRSMSGVKAMVLKRAWKKLRWSKGKVFSRYTRA